MSLTKTSVGLLLLTLSVASPGLAGEEVMVQLTFKECIHFNTQGFPVMASNATACHKRFFRNGQLFLDSQIHTDEFGRRVVGQRPHGKDVHFLAMLGDSFTLGEGIADDETTSAQLAKMLPSTAVYNYGASGY